MLSQEDALRAYAIMMNTQDVSAFADLLAEDFRYASPLMLSDHAPVLVTGTDWVDDYFKTKDISMLFRILILI